MRIVRANLLFLSLCFLLYVDANAHSGLSVREGDILIYQHCLVDQGIANGFKLDIVPANARVELTEIRSDYTNDKIKVGKARWERNENVLTKENGLKYGFPLKVGLKWGEDTEAPRRNDTMYCYYVEKIESVTVPAGTFEGCFKIVYDTCPDTSIEWYYPGVGIVKSEYHHHGTITDEISVLKKIVSARNNQ